MSLYIIQQKLLSFGLTNEQADEIIKMIRELVIDPLYSRFLGRKG